MEAVEKIRERES